MKTVIEMAREADFGDGIVEFIGVQKFERFTELVRAAEREKWMERTAILIRGEREACAKVCDDLDDDLPDGLAGWQYGEAIRARSNT